MEEKDLRRYSRVVVDGDKQAPEAILEVATDIGLREEYGLMDGDVVEVEVPDV